MSSTPRPSRPLLSWLAAALAGLLVFLCAWLTRLYLQVRAENSLLRQEQALTALELRATRNQLEAERILAAHEHAERAKKEGTRPAAPPPSPH